MKFAQSHISSKEYSWKSNASLLNSTNMFSASRYPVSLFTDQSSPQRMMQQRRLAVWCALEREPLEPGDLGPQADNVIY